MEAVCNLLEWPSWCRKFNDRKGYLSTVSLENSSGTRILDKVQNRDRAIDSDYSTRAEWRTKFLTA